MNAKVKSRRWRGRLSKIDPKQLTGTNMSTNRKGDWRVMRNCCIGGNCFECRRVTPYGKPLSIVHADGYSEEHAKLVAKNWSSYKATAERQP